MDLETLPEYEVLALKYAWRPARRADLFIGGDPHDVDAVMDYFIWLIRGEGKLFLVDTGFNQDMALKRGRTLLRTPVAALRLVGVAPEAVKQIIITHFHNDHVGGLDAFANAVFHVQDDEMDFATGRYMRHERFAKPFEPEHVCGLVRLAYNNRVVFHDGDETIVPGLSLHRIGGHTAGLQCVRVRTKRGWVVVASDASHYYEHFQNGRCFPTVFDVGAAIEGYDALLGLAESSAHVVPGHDPLVMQRYPAARDGLEDIAVSLDVAPKA